MQPERRAQRRADRLGAGEQACAHAADVAHALQIKRECKRRADNGDLQRAERHRGVERDRNPPRLREHEQHHAADEHPAARADAHTKIFFSLKFVVPFLSTPDTEKRLHYKGNDTDTIQELPSISKRISSN